MGDSAASNMIDPRGSELPASNQQTAELERLLNDCRDICLDRLSKSLAGMLDKVPGALWDLADHAREREVRDLYMAAKVRAHTQRKRIEADFRTNYLAEFAVRTRLDKKGAAFGQFDLSALELGLVNDGDLQETLKVSDMAAKLRRSSEDELAALDQEVGMLVGDGSVCGERNPFSPQAICHAFKLTCRALEPDLKLRLVLLGLFDEHVLVDARSIYKDLNTTLVERAPPPKPRHGMLGRPVGSVVAARAGAAATVAAARPPAALSARAVGVSEQEAFGVLQRPLAASVGAAATASAQRALGSAIQAPGSPPGLNTSGTRVVQGPLGSPQGTSLVASLTRIQHGDFSALTNGNPALAARLATPGTINVLRELRGTSLASGLSHTDSVTLDIVALLVDQIFADETIPPLMKGVIGQLQIPILKVAILDKSFFSKKAHSARKLLDCLGDIAVSPDADLNESGPLYGQIRKTVRELVDGFEDSMDVFDRLHEKLEGFVAGQNQRLEEQAALVAKRIEYRERLALAKAVAQREILRRARSGSIPRVVLRFLADRWVKVMLIAHAEHGNESEAWNKAVATMDLLVWSVRTKQSLAERRTLAAVLPRLLKRLNSGMRRIGVGDEDRKRFFIKLIRCHTKAMNAAPFKRAVVTPADDDTEPGAAPLEFHALTIRNPFGEGDIEIEEISWSDLPAGGDVTLEAGGTGTAMGGDEYSRIASRLSKGAWVDFRDGNNNKRRARLYYVSPLRRTYLFVIREGRSVEEYSLPQLAREFRAARANVIETIPLFDRAMGSLAGAPRTSATLQ